MNGSSLSQDFPAPETGKRWETLPGLPAQPDVIPRRRLKVCLLSSQITGADTKYGIAVGHVNLAQALAANGHQVSILQIQQESANPDTKTNRHQEFARRGIRFVSCPPMGSGSFLCTSEMVMSWQAHQWLKDQDFDIIHSPLLQGLPYYSLLAKHQGLAYQSTLWQVEFHGSSAWERLANNQHLNRISQVCVDFLERQSIELADVVWSPSEDILQRISKDGWHLPANTFVQPEIIRQPKDMLARSRSSQPQALNPAKAKDPDVIEQSWLAWHHAVGSPEPVQSDASRHNESLPLVSICLTHHNRPHLLKQALASIEAQDYPMLEVVLVDDGSTDPDALTLLEQLEPEFACRGWQILRQQNLYLGTARNNAAGHARGKYLLFMDDDNYAKPHEISTFVKVAEKTGADVLTCQIDIFQGDEPPLPNQVPSAIRLLLGNALIVGIARNYFGDANALFRRESFWKLGGFSPDYGTGHEDWEILARAALSGQKLETVPETLFWYRTGSATMIDTTNTYANHMRSLRPYLETLPDHLSDLARFALGLHLSVEQLEHENGEFIYHMEWLRANLFAHWNSRSLRLTAPARNLIRRLKGMAPESQPQARTIAEAIRQLHNLQTSLCWNLTGPFRALLIAWRRLTTGMRKPKF